MGRGGGSRVWMCQGGGSCGGHVEMAVEVVLVLVMLKVVMVVIIVVVVV
jgi:hypothetical protein